MFRHLPIVKYKWYISRITFETSNEESYASKVTGNMTKILLLHSQKGFFSGLFIWSDLVRLCELAHLDGAIFIPCSYGMSYLTSEAVAQSPVLWHRCFPGTGVFLWIFLFLKNTSGGCFCHFKKFLAALEKDRFGYVVFKRNFLVFNMIFQRLQEFHFTAYSIINNMITIFSILCDFMRIY